ncbi:MAG: serine/threonine-protein kinase [Gemmataceae bacterium]
MSADRTARTLPLPPDDATPGSPSTAPPGDPTRTLPHALPPTPPAPAGRYQFGEEIARGGMGAVYRATDTALGREVAVKVVQSGSDALARRFADEAHITGQLQHPNIPPVYDLGTLPDGRPFLAMKLIKGQTLDAMLKADGPGSGRWLPIFERICEAVGYAHAHGVIHRDLKPQNVMVGAFGEVQVMDWGLAKVLASGGRQPPVGADPEATAPGTAIVPTRDADEATRAGSVLGTPAYMPPEQAIGAVDQIDARSDVFGLGAILCAVLTGQPPYVGADAESTRQLAARGKLDDAFARLAACGAEPELVALCKRCLSPEKGDRPADAGVVASEVAALRAAAEDRAKRADLDAARLEVRAAEEAKRRRVRRALVAALAAGLVASTGFGLWAKAEADRATAQEKETEKALGQVSAEKTETQKALAQVTAEQGRTREALAAAERNLLDRDAARKRTLDALRKLTDELVGERAGRQVALTDRDRQFFRDVLKLWDEFADSREAGPDADVLRAEGAYRVGFLRFKLGEHTEAEAAYRAALGVYANLAAAHPAVPDYQAGLAATHTNLGILLQTTGRPADALPLFDRAIATLTKVRATVPANPTARQFLRNSHIGRAATRDRLGRFADAAADWDKAIELDPGPARTVLRAKRASSRLQAGQVAEAVADVAELTKGSGWDANQWYDFACVYAVASSKLADKREEYARRAVVLLQRAVKAGYKNAAHLAKDPDLDPLRGRLDFRWLLASLPKPPEAAPRPRSVR